MSDHHGPDAEADPAQSRAPVGEDVERIVACALAEYAGKDPDKPHVDRAGQTLPYPEWRRWLGEAKAAIAAMPPPPEREALRIAREAAIEECAVWHDKQASAWQDQAHGAYRQIGGSDEAYAAEFRAQHEAYTKYRIIHEQSARDLRSLLGARAP